VAAGVPARRGLGFSSVLGRRAGTPAATQSSLRLFLALLACTACAQIPEAESLVPPAPARIASVHAAAQREGWAPQAALLRAAALRAYEHDKLDAAQAWLHLHRWAALLGQTEAEFVPRWIQAVQTARVGHPNMPRHYEARARPLATAVSPGLQAWLIGQAVFSAEFFAVLSPLDYAPGVLEILEALHRADPARFRAYPALALAIAVVYDVPPPPQWPHGQVTAQALPRRFAEPLDAFAWWVKQDRAGRTLHKLARLGADELKFVVDSPAPATELEWAQGAWAHPLSQLPGAYQAIRYRNDRVASGAMMWPGGSYRLAEILAMGGICSDQAYFATQIGKARGVPTILIYGAGNDGRHAWFGYLDANKKWQLDAGRYAEQRYVTGHALDPQTWREFTDHELQFLTERFRELPAYRQSRTHGLIAAEYLALGQGRAAGSAARKAVNYERRNQEAWETLIAAARAEGRDAKTVEALLREAALAFQRYPDLEAGYVNRTADSLRARGQTSEAEAEVRRIANKNKHARGDLSIQQAREIVRRAIATQPLPEQVRAYNSAVDNYGRGAGIGFFDEVVAGFVEHLLGLKQKAEARRALDRARTALKVEPGSQLAGEFERLGREVRAAK
ncbi:MAG: hypothetical protein Q8N18_04500, partial [Opitutaceae bacterium]|nr:hypothetical protein [Opitutaceae bacterium]